MDETKHIKYAKGFKYQLKYGAYFYVPFLQHVVVETNYIRLIDGWLAIKQGYAWDGASWPAIDTKSTMRFSLVHDSLYQLMRMGLIDISYRTDIDEYAMKYTKKDGMNKFRQSYFLKGLRLFAKSAAHPDHRRREYTAP